MRTQRPGRHELGQNFLTDPEVVAAFVDLVAATDGPIIEIGAGDGALTLPLQRLGRPLTAIEVDHRRAARPARHADASTEIVRADFLRYRTPAAPHVLAGNLPFHLTTAMLRRVLRAPGWTDAVLLVQWEVARRRAGVGGATMMTAQWWPWYEFRLADRARYQHLVERVFTGRGRGLAEILPNAVPDVPRRRVRGWLRHHGVAPMALPKALTAAQWADLHRLRDGGGAG